MIITDTMVLTYCIVATAFGFLAFLIFGLIERKNSEYLRGLLAGFLIGWTTGIMTAYTIIYAIAVRHPY